MKSKILITGGIMGMLAVMLGALGAHALKALLSPDQLHSFETAVRFQVYHAIMFLFVGYINRSANVKLLRYVSVLFLWGTILFSGSIYLLTTRDITGLSSLTLLGPITPLGGMLLITGWALLVVEGIKSNRNKEGN